MDSQSVCFLTFCAVVGVALSSTNDLDGTVKEVVHHGIIRENAPANTEVKLDVPLGTSSIQGLTGREICGYTIYKTLSDLPFRIVEVDRISGSARIVVAPSAVLDYEQTHQYNFEIAAHDCATGNHAQREKVHIEVEDEDEFTPTWPEQYLSAEAVEGRVYDYLVRLQAVDRDGTDGISRICRYRIITPNVPFEVDADGYLRNTEPLSYERKSRYTVEVKAEDCGGRVSDTAVVNIDVKPVCQLTWTGVGDRVDYIPHDAAKLFAAGAELEMCHERCNLSNVAVTVQLSTEHIGKGCDRDTYSLASQRKLCGASDRSIDLLPNPVGDSWTKDLPTDDGQESDQIFAFDGKTTAIEVPKSKLNFDLGASFTLSTWLKHDENGEGFRKHGRKEHILCHSDGNGMNRHHYALFVRNCHLVLLLRREPNDATSDTDLKPAEWRWELPQICDNKWHHYSINVVEKEASLFVDGNQFIDSAHNPQIVDDWPLYLDKRVHFTKLVIGACWQGGKHEMSQHFHGYLAGLSLLRNETESTDVLRCLNECQEKLQFSSLDTMDDTTVSVNNARTKIVISGRNVDSVQKLLRRVGYVNTRTFPTPGHRPVTIETTATCSDGKELSVLSSKILVTVLDAERPIITLSAAKSQVVDERDLTHGVHLFSDLVIDARTKTEVAEQLIDSKHAPQTRDRFQLDSCLIQVDPQLAVAFEHIRYPENLVTQLGLDVDFSEDGLVIAGADRVSAYEEVLREVRYVNSEPQELNSRTFVLSCTELNGRFTSNQLETTLVVVRAVPSPAPVHAAVDRQHLSPVKLPFAKSDYATDTKSSQSGVVVTVVVACVGFVILLIAVGVRRIRNAGRHSRRRAAAAAASEAGSVADDRQEMEWDNSALTITVNPMDQQMMFAEEMSGGDREDRADSDCSDDDDETNTLQNHDVPADTSDDDTAPGDDGPTPGKTRELEWDDSTLSY